MWSGLLGGVAANKAAAAAVGISVLVGGTVVETTGVGPSVREAVQHVVSSEPDSQNSQLLIPDEGDEQDQQLVVATTDSTTLPGNLVALVNPNGRFQVRAEVVGYEDPELIVTAPGGEVAVDISAAAVNVPGKRAEEIDWSQYVGYGVVVYGSCVLPESANVTPTAAAEVTAEVSSEGDDEAPGPLADCESLVAQRVQVLGQAGQSGKPEDAGKPEIAGKPERAGDPEGIDTPEGPN